MKNIALILFLSIIVFMLGCNDDQDCPVIEPAPTPVDTVENIELEVPFIAKMGYNYQYVEDGDTIDLYLAGIFDARGYGQACDVSTGGSAEVTVISYLNEIRYGSKLTWMGCDGDNEYAITNPNLPSYQMGTNSYIIKMMKMYPLSESQELAPRQMNEYEIKLVLLK